MISQHWTMTQESCHIEAVFPIHKLSDEFSWPTHSIQFQVELSEPTHALYLMKSTVTPLTIVLSRNKVWKSSSHGDIWWPRTESHICVHFDIFSSWKKIKQKLFSLYNWTKCHAECLCERKFEIANQRYYSIAVNQNTLTATSTIKSLIQVRTLVGNKIVDHSDVVGALPVGAAPTTSSFST